MNRREKNTLSLKPFAYRGGTTFVIFSVQMFVFRLSKGKGKRWGVVLNTTGRTHSDFGLITNLPVHISTWSI